MDKEIKDTLTNEKLCKKFKSQFELVNYAIKLAENMIKTGRDPRVKMDTQNRALHVIAEIENDRDQFDEIIKEDIIKVEDNGTRYEEQSLKRFPESHKKNREGRESRK